MCFMIYSGEKGYKLPEQILLYFLTEQIEKASKTFLVENYWPYLKNNNGC